MGFIKKYKNPALVALFILLCIIILKQFLSHTQEPKGTIIIRDTTLLVRYEREIKRDTIIKWYEKIVQKKSEPEIIYYQKTDSVFIDKFTAFDLLLQVEKEKNKLLIKALNREGKILKEYVYEDVYDNFSIVSQQNNIFVKSSKYKWNGIKALLNVQFPMPEYRKPDYQPGIETGINYKNKLDLNASLNYSVMKKQFFINTKLKIKF